MINKDFHISRRGFLRNTGFLAAATTLPAWATQTFAAQNPSSPSASPNEAIQVALIGCGGQGRGDARTAKGLGAKVVAVCDVDAGHLAAALKDFPGSEGYADFRKLLERKDIDAVICGTVDHWHTLVTIAAMQAGKDIYCQNH